MSEHKKPHHDHHGHHPHHGHHEKEPSEEILSTEEAAEAKTEETTEEIKVPKMMTLSVQEYSALKSDLEEHKDKSLRLLAEMDNMRKRMQKERQEYAQYSAEQVIADFLPPLDNLENALGFASQLSDELKNWAVGFQMILTQFKDVLTNQGVVQVATKGEQFDPHVHEAIEMIETDDFVPGTIMEECVRGYKIKDRTIRPARVKVAKAKNS